MKKIQQQNEGIPPRAVFWACSVSCLVLVTCLLIVGWWTAGRARPQRANAKDSALAFPLSTKSFKEDLQGASSLKKDKAAGSAISLTEAMTLYITQNEERRSKSNSSATKEEP